MPIAFIVQVGITGWQLFILRLAYVSDLQKNLTILSKIITTFIHCNEIANLVAFKDVTKTTAS